MSKKQRKKSFFKPIVILTLVILMIGNFAMSNNSGMETNLKKERTSLNPFNLLRKENDRINILIFGVDGQNTSESQRKRADSIMLFSVDRSGEDSALLSIPRDTKVEIPNRKGYDKINHAHAYGDIELLKETVELFFDMPVDYYIRVNYKAIEEIVDALGGIEIDVPMDMKYSDPYDSPPLHIDIKKGLQVLDGTNALHFLRFRSGYATQDLGRIQAQQQFAEALMDKVTSPSIILKVPKLVNIFYNSVDTNMPKSSMFYLGTKNLLGSFDEIEKITLPGSPKMINRIAYYVIDRKDIEHIKENYLKL
ncbi:MAG: LCP family protein [Clostridiaceae bacterium]|nr:LCP family protein [Clostridiaceae bacterium]